MSMERAVLVGILGTVVIAVSTIAIIHGSDPTTICVMAFTASYWGSESIYERTK